MRDWNYENDQWMKLPSHIRHLPLFTRHFDLMSWFFRALWGFFLKGLAFRFYIRLKVVGDFHDIYQKEKRLLLISNHSSHLDAVSIAAAVPFRYWMNLYISAAKDYWFRNPVFTFFSKHCLGAIPIDRKDRSGEAIKLCTSLLTGLDRIWLIIFPEGTRSKDGFIQPFKRGISLFSMKTDTPILFLYIEGNAALMPKGAVLPRPGVLKVHVGPVYPPAPVDQLYEDYKRWVLTINPNAYALDEGESSKSTSK
ncbi:MAG: 1-acyl-sn-glycerol-3-phosphate acyltransferase [Bdellovibrionaceae bacterium]|nr:1-acyl-sn-glycerol-3-phosphate acyltransferase [Pseudobdellovibrionaceae bacterium]|tara:strand:+ start:5042 stop:5797 length:756 start_codon:yes stop_codon:yes gene_type:complete